MCFHVRLVETEDQNRFLCAQALGNAGSIHGGVAAAHNSNDAAELRRAAFLDLLQERDRVDHLAAIHCRDVEMVRDLRADGEENCVEAALRLFGENVGDPVVAQDLHAHRLDARDLLAHSVARQAIGGNAVSHHPSGLLQPLSIARSPRKRSSEWTATGWSRNWRLQALSQGW